MRQRQRIGIARVVQAGAGFGVYEATSALDTGTEEAVMGEVEGLSQGLTIVMIAHRLSTLQRCDRVIRLVNGTVFEERPPCPDLTVEF